MVHVVRFVVVVVALCLPGGALGRKSPRAAFVGSVFSRRERKSPLASVPFEVAVACTLPTCLGYWKREWGVSYAYGTAMAWSAAVVLSRELSPLAKWHAFIHFAYGVRLVAFLGIREMSVQRFRDMRERIEKKAPEGNRLARTPFIAGCSLLYFCMSLPLVASARGHTTILTPVFLTAATLGLLVAAVGDFQKSWVKARAGDTKLVTSGLYRYLRHPNYQGEQLLWFASAMAGISAATPGPLLSTALTYLLIGLGQIGIHFVLCQATTTLNARQAVNYQHDPDYQRWTAFKGFEITQRTQDKGLVEEKKHKNTAWNLTGWNITEADRDADDDDEYVA